MNESAVCIVVYIYIFTVPKIPNVQNMDLQDKAEHVLTDMIGEPSKNSFSIHLILVWWIWYIPLYSLLCLQ